MRLDREPIHDIAQMRDPGGVVSVYVDIDPAEAASARPGWVEAVHVELGRLGCNERLRQLRPQIAETVDPARHGRGRALFFGVSAGGSVHSFALQMPLETSVTLSELAHLQPLLAAVDAGRPAGIVVLSMAELRALEVAWGEAVDVERIDMTPPPAEWNRLKEPNGLREEDRLHIVRLATPRVEALARARGWDRIVIAGSPRLTRPLAAKVAGRLDATAAEAMRQVLPEDHPAHIAAQLGPHIADAGARRAAALLDRARDAALAGGAGAVGVDDVLAAVTEGNARWVAIDGEAPLRASGVQDPERGVRLLDRVDVAPMLIQRSLATRADVAVLPGAEHPQLAEAGAVALLRW